MDADFLLLRDVGEFQGKRLEDPQRRNLNDCSSFRHWSPNLGEEKGEDDQDEEHAEQEDRESLVEIQWTA